MQDGETAEVYVLHRSVHKNIPYGQSSAKLPVIWSFDHLVTRSLGYSVNLSLGHLVTWSQSHHLSFQYVH